MSGAVDLAAVWRAAVAACDPRRVVRECGVAIDAPITLVAIGKAAGAMAAGALDAWGDGLGDGIVVTVDGVQVPESVTARGWRVRRAGHPVPDARSEAAGREVMALARGVPAGVVLLVLVSGGASALCAVPRDGLTLDEKVRRVSDVMRSGAPIAELNRVRKDLSAVKGGQLAAMCPAQVVTLVVSDVPGDDVSVVGSGPTVPGKPGDSVHLIAGIARFRREAATTLSDGDGVNVDNISVEEREEVLEGPVEEVAREIVEVARRLERGCAWVAGGEWTVRVGESAGRGGRATHLALVVAKEIAGTDVRVLVAGSDGVDGTGPWAGAIVDGKTWGWCDGDEALAAFDSGSALAEAAATIGGGPTGVNHADLVIVVRE